MYNFLNNPAKLVVLKEGLFNKNKEKKKNWWEEDSKYQDFPESTISDIISSFKSKMNNYDPIFKNNIDYRSIKEIKLEYGSYGCGIFIIYGGYVDDIPENDINRYLKSKNIKMDYNEYLDYRYLDDLKNIIKGILKSLNSKLSKAGLEFRYSDDDDTYYVYINLVNNNEGFKELLSQLDEFLY